MDAMKKQVTELEEKVSDLQVQIVSIQQSLIKTHALIKYLSTAQAELASDMSKIYKSLRAVLSNVSTSKPVQPLLFPVLGSDDDDDDLLN